MPFNPEKLKKLQAKGAGARLGGKGSVRRKKKTVRKNVGHDDKRLKKTLNQLHVREIPAIEEVNLFKDDGTVIHFNSPKVQASIAANTYVVSGTAEQKTLQELLPGIINQLSPDNLEKIYQSYSAADGGANVEEDSDDDVPDLVDNFEEAAAKVVEQTEKDDDEMPELVES